MREIKDDERQPMIVDNNDNNLPYTLQDVEYFPFKTNGEKSESREENIFTSLRLFCCPRLGWLQFITIISIIEILIFIVSICVYGLDNESFLAPNYEALKIMGSADAKSTKNDYQLYRLIMPAFLHANLEHISGNVVFQIYIGSGIEYSLGFWRFALLYLVSEIGGVLLAITVHPEAYGVGASCAGYGLIGWILAYVFTNWTKMGTTRWGFWQRVFLSFVFFFFFLSNQGLTLNQSWESRNIGHQGGLVTGFLMGLTITEQYDQNALMAGRTPDRYSEADWKDRSAFRNFVCARCGFIFLVAYFVTLICLFYLWTDVNVEQEQ